MSRLVILAACCLILFLETPLAEEIKEGHPLFTCGINHPKKGSSDEVVYEDDPYDDPEPLQAPTKACCQELKFDCKAAVGPKLEYFCIGKKDVSYMDTKERMSKCCDKNKKGTRANYVTSSSAWEWKPCK